MRCGLTLIAWAPIQTIGPVPNEVQQVCDNNAATNLKSLIENLEEGDILPVSHSTRKIL